MMKHSLIYICLFNFIFGFGFELSLGGAYNLNQDISITRDSHADIDFDASFDTHGLESPQYYSLRFKYQIKKKNMELEFIHHKLYVEENLPDQVEKFEVSDGYNLLLINLVNTLSENINYRLGVGTVITHPDIMIDGQTNYIKGGGLIPKIWTDGYHWGGISSQASVFYNYGIKDNLSMNIETKLIYASASVPVVGGSFILPNLSIHFLVGISFGK